MEDIRLAVGLMIFVSGGAYALVWRLLRSQSATVMNIAACVNLALVFAYVWFVWGQLWIVKWIPLPSVIILSNWFPILLCAFAGIVWCRMQAWSLLRRLLVIGGLVICAAYSLTSFIPSEPPECNNN